MDKLEVGRRLYEQDVLEHPAYHDGTPRRTWDQLGYLARWSWSRIEVNGYTELTESQREELLEGNLR